MDSTADGTSLYVNNVLNLSQHQARRFTPHTAVAAPYRAWTVRISGLQGTRHMRETPIDPMDAIDCQSKKPRDPGLRFVEGLSMVADAVEMVEEVGITTCG